MGTFLQKITRPFVDYWAILLLIVNDQYINSSQLISERANKFFLPTVNIHSLNERK